MTNKETRFEFGKNWKSFLRVIDEDRVVEAEKSLTTMFECSDFSGKNFLDVGCGSGLFSLAARRLGAMVHSFDYDANSTFCAKQLKKRYFPEDTQWSIEQGSVLDKEYLGKFHKKFDFVYSWGVLHHTGALWQALENLLELVKPNGNLYIAIYNDQGKKSLFWKKLKRFYNQIPVSFRPLLVLGIGGWWEFRAALLRAIRLRNPLPFETWRDKKKSRGMSVWHDLVDWIGGWPFEVAKPEEVFKFVHDRGYSLESLKTCGGGLGNNEFVFKKRTE